MDSFGYLKLDQLNYLNFKCQDYNNRIMSIEQELTLRDDEGKKYNVN